MFVEFAFVYFTTIVPEFNVPESNKAVVPVDEIFNDQIYPVAAPFVAVPNGKEGAKKR